MSNILTYDKSECRVVITAQAISSFAVYGRGIPFTPSDTECTAAEVNVILNHRCDLAGIPATLTCVAESVSNTPDGYAVSLTVDGCRRTDRPDNFYAESARLVFTAYLLCHEKKADFVILKLILSGKETVTYEYKATVEFLGSAVYALLNRAMPFIKRTVSRERELIPSLKELPFPYPEMREAQYEFITEAFRTVKNSSRLLVSAPTGTGKTISALYPAVRSIGEGLCDKVFCLCAKTTVGKAFTDAAELLSRHAPLLRTVVISSKERCCPIDNHGKGPRSRMCRTVCPLWEKTDGKFAEIRLMEAATKCLKTAVITADIIKTVAEEYSVCPHELSLFVSEYCDIIVCDYNYVFDFRMRIRRYFDDEAPRKEERLVFLADEVHNLPSRACDTYSAELSVKMIAELLANAVNLGDEPAVSSTAKSLLNELETIRLAAVKEGDSHEIGGKLVQTGFSNTSALPEKVVAVASSLRKSLGSAIVKYGDSLPPFFASTAEAVAKFCHVASLFDKGFTCFASAIGDEFYLRLCCLDPAPLLDLAMKDARAVIFFSATLTPISYYADILGCRNGGVLELDSPFPKENLCPVAVDSVSMKLSERGEAADTVAECIAAAAESNPGNYLAFFPSFDYMEKVLKLFRSMSPDTKIVVQERSMKLDARERFLSAFAEERDDYTSLVGFAVLGGIFSEGIDLPGNSLIGVIIAGTGMPAITSERNIMKEYFQETREGGMEYAYVYPGFNNVLQAAGRVIRTDTDRGVLILIDSRYSEPTYYKLFPKYWRHIKYTGDPFSLEEILRRFWETE